MKMSRVDKFLEECEYQFPDEPLVYPTDLKDAIVGTVEHFSFGNVILLDKEKCINILCTRDGMTIDEAMEHFEFNVIGAYVDGCPAYATFIDGVFEKEHVCNCSNGCKGVKNEMHYI